MSQTNENKTKQNNFAAQVAKNKEEVFKWTNSMNYDTKSRSWDVLFKKTTYEKLALATLKLRNREDVRKAGYNPNKRFNTSEPFYAVIW